MEEETKQINLFVCGKFHYHMHIKKNEKCFLKNLLNNEIPNIVKKTHKQFYSLFDFESKNRILKAYSSNGDEIKPLENPKTKSYYFDPWLSNIVEIDYETDLLDSLENVKINENLSEKQKKFEEAPFEYFLNLEKNQLKMEEKILKLEKENKDLKLIVNKMEEKILEWKSEMKNNIINFVKAL